MATGRALGPLFDSGWRWRPNRWWPVLALFVVVSLLALKAGFAVSPVIRRETVAWRYGVSVLLRTGPMLGLLVLAALTDRGRWIWPQRIAWMLGCWYLKSFLAYGLMQIVIAYQAYPAVFYVFVLADLPFAVWALRRSGLFVVPATGSGSGHGSGQPA
jgi:hypothetical protein